MISVMPCSTNMGVTGDRGKNRFFRHFRGRIFPSGRGPAIAKVGAIATHAGPGVNCHGKRGKHGPPQPAPEGVLPPSPKRLGDVKGKKCFGGWVGVRGFGGSSGVGWKGRESSLQSLTTQFPEEP